MDEQDGKREAVLVTGGSGFVARWAIVEALRRGYRVRTTLRTLGREPEVRAAVAREVSADDRLSFVEADLLRDDGWAQATDGMDFVLHVASPMGVGDRTGESLIRPAREGTLRVLKAAAGAGVRRVVLTSSVVASLPATSSTIPTDETVWTDLDAKGVNHYTRSKTLAERAAWDFMREAKGAMTLATILPGMILGPVLGEDFSASLEIVSRMLQGRIPRLPRIGFSTIDVRDLVALHVAAMTSPAAAGERFIATTDFVWMADIARILRDHLGARASKVPTGMLPDFVLRLASLFNEEARWMAPSLGQRRTFTTAKAERRLDWHPRPASQAILDTAESLFRVGLV